MKRALLLLIHIYQLFFSFFFGSCCRFFPSCSEYAKEAITEHGTFKGIWLTVRRLLKCGPWHKGGVDLVPPKRKT